MGDRKREKSKLSLETLKDEGKILEFRRGRSEHFLSITTRWGGIFTDSFIDNNGSRVIQLEFVNRNQINRGFQLSWEINVESASRSLDKDFETIMEVILEQLDEASPSLHGTSVVDLIHVNLEDKGFKLFTHDVEDIESLPFLEF